jgi:hypothetical protein
MGASETWLPVVGFEGFYEVSDLGRVRSLTRRVRSPRGTRLHTGQVMTPVIDRDGYPRVILRVDGKHYTRKIHRLVCRAFNGPPNALHREVDHIDANRANATAQNLRWVSRGENAYFTRGRVGALGERNGNAKLTRDAVSQIKLKRGIVSGATLAAAFGVSPYAIYDIWRGRRWAHVQ